METGRRKAPDAIDVYEGKDPFVELKEAEDIRKLSKIKPKEKLWIDILSEKEMKNMGNAINERNPWEY